MGQVIGTSEAAAIGLHCALVLAAEPEQPLNTAAMARRLDVSAHHCSKVLQRLTRAGLVRAVRGPKGGFQLARPPETVTLLEVYEAIDGPLRDTTCLFHQPHCRLGECVLSGMFEQVNRVVRSHLSAASLADIVARRPERFRVVSRSGDTG
ncbi:MAG: Rrf2 family transcriptional regulator [Pirellulaceae bacterium]